MPIVSIVMPVFNNAKTIDRAVESIRAQCFGQWEVVAVDDCSQDDSVEVLERWQHIECRVRVFRMPVNSGPAAARNRALSECRGDIVCYLDADDEYFSDYLERVVKLIGDQRRVTVCGFDQVIKQQDGTEQLFPTFPRRKIDAWFAECIVIPLGIAHPRRLLQEIGGFNELASWQEDWDLWKRFSRTGADVIFCDFKSGRYHHRPDSQTRQPNIPLRTRKALRDNFNAGRALYHYFPHEELARTKTVRRILYASPICLIDSSSGAAIATQRSLGFLNELGFQCEAFCGSTSDAPEEILVQEQLASRGIPYDIQNGIVCGQQCRILNARVRGTAVNVYLSGSTRGRWTGIPEIKAFLQSFARWLEAYRPDAVLTYGGDPVSLEMMRIAKSYDLPVVFGLHNLAYNSPQSFRHVDYVVVPSQFSRQFYWYNLGLASHVLPNIVHDPDIEVDQWVPRYLTFINPQQDKGVFIVFAIAKELARLRPEIPILIVEGRGQNKLLKESRFPFSALPNVTFMPNTPRPSEFYRVTKALLVPSLCNESFCLAAAEALTNGIPVLASNRGALPDTVGEGGFVLDIPVVYTPSTEVIPKAQEIETWIKTIVRLWDDSKFFHASSDRAHKQANVWHSHKLSHVYRDFFSNITPQPTYPVVPLSVTR